MLQSPQKYFVSIELNKSFTVIVVSILAPTFFEFEVPSGKMCKRDLLFIPVCTSNSQN